MVVANLEIEIENEGESFEQLRLPTGNVLYWGGLWWVIENILAETKISISVSEALILVGPEWRNYILDRSKDIEDVEC